MNASLKAWLGLGLGLLAAEPVTAQQTPQAQRTVTHVIESKLVADAFRIDVALPEDYAASGQFYPVIYVLDGDKSFGLVAGIVDWLSWAREIPRQVVVGISYGGGTADWWQARARDLTPTLDSVGPYGRWPGSGGADAFRAFLGSELMPYINERYRVAGPGTVIGLSFGGLFSAYDLLQADPLFEQYLLVSPALAWDDEMIAAAEESGRTAGRVLRGRVYGAVGSLDRPTVLDPSRRFFQQLARRDGGELAFAQEEFPGETHISVFPGAVTHGLKWLTAAR